MKDGHDKEYCLECLKVEVTPNNSFYPYCDNCWNEIVDPEETMELLSNDYSCGTRFNIKLHTSIDTDDYAIQNMNQKLNYYKALQIAASLTPRVEARGFKS